MNSLKRKKTWIEQELENEKKKETDTKQQEWQRERKGERKLPKKGEDSCSLMTYLFQISSPPMGTMNLQFYTEQLLQKEMQKLAG